MIIKSMSRKQPSFTQLFDYIVRDHDNDTRYNFTHNCFGTQRDDILNEFYTNSDNLKRRKGSNYLYHEILSITRSKQLTEDQQKDLLRDIVQQYINARAKDCLVFAGLHDEKYNQLHYHLIISANKVNEKKRYYHSKKDFDDIKVNLETYVLERYPELEQAKLISQDKKVAKQNKISAQTHEGEYTRRTGKQSKKQQFAEKLKRIFADACDFQDYNEKLRQEEIQSYVRGQNMGFITSGRKHRASTLGIMEEFDDMLLRFQSEQQSEHHSQHQAEQKTTHRQSPEETAMPDHHKEDDPSIFEKTGDTIKEWVAGDFSHREQEQKTEKTSEDQASKKQAMSETEDKASLYDDMVKKRMAQMKAKYEDMELAKKQALAKGKDNGRS